MVYYAIRHSAHYRCYLEAGKTLADLKPHQIRLFPYKLLKEFGLLSEAEAALELAKGE